MEPEVPIDDEELEDEDDLTPVELYLEPSEVDFVHASMLIVKSTYLKKLKTDFWKGLFSSERKIFKKARAL